jgi:hypothetical protein
LCVPNIPHYLTNKTFTFYSDLHDLPLKSNKVKVKVLVARRHIRLSVFVNKTWAGDDLNQSG